MNINKLILRIVLIYFFVFVACKAEKKVDISKKETINEPKKDKLRNVIEKEIVYSYKDTETNDFQKIIIIWNKDYNKFNFRLITDTDLCKYEDKGKAVFKESTTFFVIKHPKIRYMKFNKSKTTIKLICDYGDKRDECDPIQEFKMNQE